MGSPPIPILKIQQLNRLSNQDGIEIRREHPALPWVTAWGANWLKKSGAAVCYHPKVGDFFEKIHV
jgi:hypothetical protein